MAGQAMEVALLYKTQLSIHNSTGLCFSLAEIHTALQSKACYFPGAPKYDCTALLSAILDIQLKIAMGNN